MAVNIKEGTQPMAECLTFEYKVLFHDVWAWRKLCLVNNCMVTICPAGVPKDASGHRQLSIVHLLVFCQWGPIAV